MSTENWNECEKLLLKVDKGRIVPKTPEEALNIYCPGLHSLSGSPWIFVNYVPQLTQAMMIKSIKDQFGVLALVCHPDKYKGRHKDLIRKTYEDVSIYWGNVRKTNGKTVCVIKHGLEFLNKPTSEKFRTILREGVYNITMIFAFVYAVKYLLGKLWFSRNYEKGATHPVAKVIKQYEAVKESNLSTPTLNNLEEAIVKEGPAKLTKQVAVKWVKEVKKASARLKKDKPRSKRSKRQPKAKRSQKAKRSVFSKWPTKRKIQQKSRT